MTERMTVSQLRKLQGVDTKSTPKKKSKYGNAPVVEDGEEFDSHKEKRRYKELLDLQRLGLIHDLQTQVSFELLESVKFKYEKKRKCAVRYIADFTYMQDGQMIVEDVKSEITKKLAVYRLKKHLMMLVHNLEIIEV